MDSWLCPVYLHYVLDMWFDVKVKRQCQGEAYLIRYCDDFVCCFQNKWEAEEFFQRLIERFRKFGLELALEKTKILEFGRFAKQNRARRELGKPETFDFLGFTFYCSEDGKKGFFRCKVKTSKKKFRSKVKTMKEWIRNNRIMPVGDLIKMINQKLRGHYQYYGVTDNTRGVKSYQNVVKWQLFKWLNRRSQRRSYTLDTFFNGLMKSFPLLEPTIKVSLFYRWLNMMWRAVCLSRARAVPSRSMGGNARVYSRVIKQAVFLPCLENIGKLGGEWWSSQSS